jgi:hypothetical protein
MPTVAFEPVDGVDVCRVEIEASSGPAFVDTPKEPRTADVYVRIGTSTRRLLADELLRYRETHRD